MTIPGRDGQETIFQPSICGEVPGSPAAKVVYINGMMISGEQHARHAQWFADVLSCPVHGIYNGSGGQAAGWERQAQELRSHILRASPGGSEFERALASHLHDADARRSTMARFLDDLVESSSDYLVLLGTIAALSDWQPPDAPSPPQRPWSMRGPSAREILATRREHEERINATARLEARFGSDSTRLQLARDVLSRNQAALSLLNLLEREARVGARIHLIAHSQGNLIASATVGLFCAVRGGRTPPITVYAVGSPSPAWPPMRSVLVWHYSFADDLVTQLSMGTSRAGQRVEVRAHGDGRPDVSESHAIESYRTSSSLVSDIRRDLGR